MASNTSSAMTKRQATNDTGGRSRSPILITSQVELQTTQSVSQETGIRQSLKPFVAAFIGEGDTRGETPSRKGSCRRRPLGDVGLRVNGANESRASAARASRFAERSVYIKVEG